MWAENEPPLQTCFEAPKLPTAPAGADTWIDTLLTVTEKAT